MSKKISENIDIFQFIKGAAIKGGYKPVNGLAVRNINQNQLSSLMFDPKKHIDAFKIHIEICKYFYENNIYNVEKSNKIEPNGKPSASNRVKTFDYVFLNEKERSKLFKSEQKQLKYLNNEAVKNTIENWNSYIKVLNEIDNKIDDEVIEKIYKRLVDTNYKPLTIQLINVNKGDSIKVSTTITDPITKSIDDMVLKGGIDIDTSENDIKLSNGNITLLYNFDRKTFNGKTTNDKTFSETEKICTLITIYLGRLHANELTLKSEKSHEGKNATVRKKNISGILKTVISKYKKSILDERNTNTLMYDKYNQKNVLITDIFHYFNDHKNNEKIIFDLIIGSSIYKDLKINAIINSWGISIVNNHNELKIINAIDDYHKHVNLIKETNTEDIMHIYSIYGNKELRGIDGNLKKINHVDLFFYGILLPNIIYDKVENKNFKTPVNTIIDTCIKDIVKYFEQKENSLQRKFYFFRSFNGSIKELLNYRNRINLKNKMLDINDSENIISKQQLKETLFNHLFC